MPIMCSSKHTMGIHMTTVAEQQKALVYLRQLADDISMLASGEWVPDDAGCLASLDGIERVRSFVASVSLPPTAE